MFQKKFFKLLLGIMLISPSMGQTEEDDFNTDPPVYPDDRPITTMPLEGSDLDMSSEAQALSTALDRPKKIHQDDRILDLEDQVRELRQQIEEVHQQFEQRISKESKSLPLATPEVGTSTDENIHAKANDETKIKSSATALYEQAQEHLLQEAYLEAERTLKQLIDQYPQDPLIINAHYWLGESYYIQKDYKRAAVAFAEVYKRYRAAKKEQATAAAQSNLEESFAKVPEALIKLARSLKAMGKTTQACIPLNQLHVEFPKLPAHIKKSLEMIEKDLPQCQKDDKNIL